MRPAALDSRQDRSREKVAEGRHAARLEITLVVVVVVVDEGAARVRWGTAGRLWLQNLARTAAQFINIGGIYFGPTI